MKQFLLIGILFYSTTSWSQFGDNILPYLNLPTDSTLCSLGGTDSVYNRVGYSSYHTQNDIWDGPIDSNYCLSNGSEFQSGLFTHNAEVDSARPVFIETDMGSGIILEPNINYRFYVEADNPNLIDTDCSDSTCSKLYLQIRKPNSSMTGDTVVVWELNVIQTQGGMLYACFVTEKFWNEQYLERFVFQMEPNNPLQQDIRFSSYLFEFPFGGLIEQFSNTNFASYYSNPEYTFEDFGWETQYIGFHDQPGYPSNSNIHYVDVTPIPNTSTPQNVDVLIQSGAHLVLQPFVEFRGGEVQGGGDYHTFTIDNQGSEVCLMPLVEIKIADGNAYKHSGGNVLFGGDATCMLFDSGGSLVVAEDETFEYGQKSVGMLGLHSGGKIVIEEDATLVINNLAVLADDLGENSEGVHVYMSPGSTLDFSDGAALKDWSNNGTMRLIVHVDRSWVYTDQLTEVERELVVLVYDAAEDKDHYFQVQENPVSNDVVSFELMNYEGQSYEVQMYDMQGNFIIGSEFNGQLGMNKGTLEASQLGAGTYILKLQCNDRLEESLFVKL